MYEAVVPYPVGSSTQSRFARTASRYGYDGLIALRPYDGTAGDPDPPHGAFPQAGPETTRSDTDGEVIAGALIDAADRDRASVALERSRPNHTVVVCRAPSQSLQRFAAASEGIDVLLVPPKGGALEHGTVKIATNHDVRIAVDLGPVIRDRDGDRVRAIAALQRRQRLLEDLGTEHIVTVTPRSHLALRSPRDLAALGGSVDLGREWIREGLGAWGSIVERNRRRRSAAYIEPGVYRGEMPDSGSGCDSPTDRDRGNDPEGNPDPQADPEVDS